MPWWWRHKETHLVPAWALQLDALNMHSQQAVGLCELLDSCLPLTCILLDSCTESGHDGRGLLCSAAE
ncbi:hypothetical protein M3J09_011218 [Ascochyta lentis]